MKKLLTIVIALGFITQTPANAQTGRAAQQSGAATSQAAKTAKTTVTTVSNNINAITTPALRTTLLGAFETVSTDLEKSLTNNPDLVSTVNSLASKIKKVSEEGQATAFANALKVLSLSEVAPKVVNRRANTAQVSAQLKAQGWTDEEINTYATALPTLISSTEFQDGFKGDAAVGAANFLDSVYSQLSRGALNDSAQYLTAVRAAVEDYARTKGKDSLAFAKEIVSNCSGGSAGVE